MNDPRRLLLLAALTLAACNPLPVRKLELTPAPPGEVAAVVRSELDRAHHQGRQLLVYVGATWCEPCERFKSAARAGKLDADFPTLRLLVFDNDADGERLRAAGYTSQYIPMFARPTADGTSSHKQIEGSVKGDGAIGQLTPRLRELLAGS